MSHPVQASMKYAVARTRHDLKRENEIMAGGKQVPCLIWLRLIVRFGRAGHIRGSSNFIAIIANVFDFSR